MEEQASVAVAPPLEFNHAIKSAELSPSHSTVKSLDGVSIIGGVLSVMVIVCTWSAAEFPLVSSRDHVLDKIYEPLHGPETKLSE